MDKEYRVVSIQSDEFLPLINLLLCNTIESFDKLLHHLVPLLLVIILRFLLLFSVPCNTHGLKVDLLNHLKCLTEHNGKYFHFQEIYKKISDLKLKIIIQLFIINNSPNRPKN